MSRIADVVRNRPGLHALARRVARTRLGRSAISRIRRPAISVIVPFYGVEEYLASCLDSLLRQDFGDFEVLLVDDGSLDGSRKIAERYAARDRRFRVVTRPNGGLGAARNTGVREARGRFLTFLDSDDELPPGALRVLHATAVATGSEIVAGGLQRFNSLTEWLPTWVPDVHGRTLLRTTAEDFLPLLRNLYTCDKLFRRDFWTAQDVWFREGVAYEDQPLVTVLLARARSIDVIPDVVYRYRQRDDQSSISQQTASIADLRDRIAAWRVSSRAIRAEFSDTLYQGWLATLFQAHFQWYLTSPGTEDDTYWQELAAEVRELAGGATQQVWDETQPAQRVLVRLTQLDRRADVQEFVRGGGPATADWPAQVRADGVLLELPLLGDPELPDELFLLRPSQLRVAHAIENLHWLGEDAATEGWISGWAYVRKIDLSRHEQHVVVELRGDQGDERLRYAATEVPPASFAPPQDDLWCDYSAGRFGVRFPLADLAGHRSQRWTAWLEVEVAGFRVTRPVTRLIRSGSAGVVPAATLGDGARIVPVWQYARELDLRVDRSAVVASEATLQGDVLEGTLDPEAADRVTRMALVGSGREVVVTRSGATWRVQVPDTPPPADGLPLRWRLLAWTGVGPARDVVPAAGALRSPTHGALLLETDTVGTIQVSRWGLGAIADEVTVTDTGELEVQGRLLGPDSGEVVLRTRNKRARAVGAPGLATDGRFHATLALAQEKYRFGRWPLPIGDHDVRATVSVAGRDAPVEVPLLVSPAVSAALPLRIDSDHLEGRVVRGPEGDVRVTVQRPIGEARGRYEQNRRQRSGPVGSGLVRGVLMRSYFGEHATDNGLSIQRALQARGSDLPVYWAVQDYSVPVPDGGIPVVVNSAEWYRLIFGVQYYVDNMFQPDYHQKADGQILVETFHGYPFKKMGLPHWRNLLLSQSRIDSYARRTADWDYLLSPARYATPLLTQDFGYDGEVLEIGYPRNDVLKSPEADRIRADVRACLGIPDDATAVLYAPTFRDYLASGDNISVMPDLFDLEKAAARLGDDFVILVRGHAFNARSERRIAAIPGCIEVTDYPEVSDLYLAADAAVVDYSSLRFDFGVTGKPMVFHVPDLQRYQDTRGWLLDFEPTAPGPLVETTDQAIDRLLDLEAVRSDFAPAYKQFTDDFLDLEDGHAGERFVDAIFVPRGDA